MQNPGAPRTIRPTTKECNSRVYKDFGSWKARCYNRVKEIIFVYRVHFPHGKYRPDALRLWQSRLCRRTL